MLLTFLRLRSWLGWGWHPDDLRVRARLNLRTAFWMLPLMVTVVLFEFGFLELLRDSSRRALILPDLVRYAVVEVAIFVLFIVVLLLLPALSSRILAQRAQSERPAIIYGRCFATIPDPHEFLNSGRLYACIGPSPERARWYVLPLEWDTFIEPSHVELELTVIQGSSCVERVYRRGPNPRDLRLADVAAQEDDGMTLVEMRQAAQAAVDAAASPEERAALRHFARHVGIAARYPPTTILIEAWLLLVLGALFGPGQVIASAILFVLFPVSFRDQGGRVAGLIYLGLVLIVGMAVIIYGVHFLRVGRRARASRFESPAIVTGKVVSWMPYRDFWTSSSDRRGRTETIIRIRLPDGTTPIFCIPKVYMHRVRELGVPARITYLPSTGRVGDVRRLEQPGEASSTD